MNKFDQLVQDLLDSKITHTQLQIAYRVCIRQRNDIPEGIKDLLCGIPPDKPGLIYKAFDLISQIIGAVELAYLRGEQGED